MFNKIRNLWNDIFWNDFKNNSLVNKSKIIRDIFVTLFTFLVPILIFCLQTRHDENSLRPYINFNSSRNRGYVIVELENAGVGPAIIDNIIIRQDNKLIEADNLYDAINWDSKYSYTFNDGTVVTNQKISKEFTTDYMIDFLGDSLAVGESLTLLRYEPTEEKIDTEEIEDTSLYITEQIRTMRYVLSNMNVTIEYHDVFDNKFRACGDFDTFKEQFIEKDK